ncbi:MAG: hypothetical protein R3B06_31715 [Kofleriaceae bacterium]
MKKLALGALLTGFLAACGGGGSDDIQPIDSGTVDTSNTIDAPAATCNPLSPPGMQGCAANEKCTWITIATMPENVGKTGCVPDGAVAQGGACTRGAAGETTGFDDCSAGNICISGTCQDICGFDGSANAACAAGGHCTQYNALFGNTGEDPIAGACNPTCNPLTQLQDTNGQSCGMGKGCYVLVNTTESYAVCAGAGDVGIGQDITGPAFANSCVPGGATRRAEPGQATSQCGALCQPNDVSQGLNEADEGGVAPHTCSALGAAPPDSPSEGESCRYWWARESFNNLSPFSNTLGWCFKHVRNWIDTNGDMAGDIPWPRCITLTDGDVFEQQNGMAPDMAPDALEYFCKAAPAMLSGAMKHAKQFDATQFGRADALTGWQ